MESRYAHIENGEITNVEMVADDFFNANPQRYSGTWKKVGSGTLYPECSKGDVYIESKDKMIHPSPYPSWSLNPATDEWEAPKPKPGENYYWDEKSLSWKLGK